MGKNEKVFSLKSGIRQGCLLCPYLFNTVCEVVTAAIKQLKEIKRLQIGKEVKVSLLADDMMVYISNLKNSTRELLQLINTFSNVVGYKINSNN